MSTIRPAERRQLTVMFCDMVASTELSLRLDPEEFSDVIQTYRQRCAAIITSCGGFVARHVGDGILAYFGYPRAHENDAERAIRAALGIAKAARPEGDADAPLVHIGIATGLVVIGNLPQAGEDLSAVGSALNLAARLESLAGPGMVVVSEETRQLSRKLFDYRDLGPQSLKGFNEPVAAWEVLGERTVGSRFHQLRDAALTPLVDRTGELAELRRLWELARTGKGQAVLLTSEAGVGKSRLAEAFADGIEDPKCVRTWYHCSPNLQGSPLAPVIRQFTVAAALVDTDDNDAKLRKIARLVPPDAANAQETVALLANLLSVRYEGHYPALQMSPHLRKHRLFEALVQLVESVAVQGSMLLIVEDLHWVDPSFDELIGMVIERLAHLPIFTLLTARPEFQSHWDGQPHVHRMVLQPLQRQDSIAMIGLICGDRRIPEETVGQIADKTDGLPLFIEDLTKDVLESAVRPAAPATAAAFPIPATLHDSLMSRLDRLGSAKNVAQTAAVIGRSFDYELLAQVAGLPEEALKEELYRLVDAGLLVSRRATSVPGFSFKHALVRDAAYSSLLKKRQAELHEQISRVLIESFPENVELQPEVLAYHFEAAGDAYSAADRRVAAAKLSARRSGFAEAIAQLERALRLLATKPPSRERLQRELVVQRTLGGIYAEHRGFSSAECGKAYATALDACRALGDAREIFSVLSGLGSFAITRADFAQCRSLAEECLARAAAQESASPHVMGHLLYGGTLFLEGDLAAAREHLEEAQRIYGKEGAANRGRQVLYVQDQKSTGSCYLALALTLMGRVDEGVREGEGGLAHSQSLGGPHTINFSLCYLAAVHHIGRDPRAALGRATQSLALAREQGFATWIGISQSVRGASLVSAGHAEEGIAELEGGIEAHAAVGAITYQPFALGLLAGGLMAVGRQGDALATLDRALAMTAATGERFYAAELLRLKGDVLASTRGRDAAEPFFREAIALARRQGAGLLELRSAVSLARSLEGPGRDSVLREIVAPLCERLGAANPGACADLAEARALLTPGIARP